MCTVGDEYTVRVRAMLDDKAFEFAVTGDGNRIIASTGIKKLVDQKYWIPVQKTCQDVKPAGNNRESVPIKWFMAATANPPDFIKAKHRLILRMVHMICHDARVEGTKFRSDKVFARTTPVLQIERNVLESADLWAYNAGVYSKPPKKRRHKDYKPHSEGSPKRQKRPLLLFGPTVTDLAVIDDTITSSTSAVEREHFGLPILRGLFRESTSVMDFVKGLSGFRKLEMETKHAELDHTSKCEIGVADAAAKRVRDDADAAAKRVRDDADAAAKREIMQEREQVEIDYAIKKLESTLEDNNEAFAKEFNVVADGCPLVTRMTKLLLRHLGPDPNCLQAPCSTESCTRHVSVFAFAVAGNDLSSLKICCLDCAEDAASKVKLCRVREMDRVRAQTWLCAAGEQGTTICAVCGDQDLPIGVLQDGWQLAHRRARVKGGKRDPSNLAVAHTLCNLEQGTRHLEEVRACAGLAPYQDVLDIRASRNALRAILR